MPVHDWTRVDAGIFHDFHVGWLPEIRTVLNRGLLPAGFYALTEQHAGRSIADVLTLHASPASPEPLPPLPAGGGTALAEAPPQVRRRQTVEATALSRRRSLAIRHVSGHRLVALIEILSPANKDRPQHVEDLVAKAVSAVDLGIHLLVVDLFPPGRHDPRGLHGAILAQLDPEEPPYDLPAEAPLTLASYSAGPKVEIFLEHIAVGTVLPDMPLFLSPERYVQVPLEQTYNSAFTGTPAYWRDILEA